MNGKRKILLLVDDSRLKAEIEKDLGRYDYHFVDSAGNEIQAVFDQVPYLVIVDEHYREGEGRALALGIKDDAILKYIPVVLVVSRDISYQKESGKIDFYARRTEKIQPLIHKILSKNYHELDLNPLTHLPGTRSSVLRVEDAIRSKKKFAVCYVDLSNLAAINGAYGDERGDRIIVKLGEICRQAVKKNGVADDFLGHLGGDNFIVVTQCDAAQAVSETIIKLFDAAIPSFYDASDREQGYIVQKGKDGLLTRCPIMSVSVAIVHNETLALTKMAQISRIAGELKNYMKSLPGSCYIKHQGPPQNGPRTAASPVEVHFPTKLKTISVSKLSSEADSYGPFFDLILAEKKIRTVYQPILDLKSQKIIGYEALTRSTLEQNVLQDAAKLFSAARESGRVKELDRICVECALKSGQKMEPGKKLFLNLNPETLMDRKIMKEIFSSRGAIAFENLAIEVTEQSILRSFEKIKEALSSLKERGIAVAIDDVGGGAVSLRDVAVLKPDYIKLDRSLIRQMDKSTVKQQIVLSLILFANGIHAATTAEGIETPGEYRTALMCGIDLGQGYYFARPGEAFPKITIADQVS